MDEKAFERIVEDMENVPLIPEHLILAAVKSGVRVSGRTPKPVSRVERQMLQATSFGLTSEMTAKVYGVSDTSVKEALRRARYKLCAKNTTHAVALAIRTGLIQ